LGGLKRWRHMEREADFRFQSVDHALRRNLRRGNGGGEDEKMKGVCSENQVAREKKNPFLSINRRRLN